MSADLVYGRQPVHEATRGRRGVQEILVTERAAKTLPWLRGLPTEVRVTSADEIGALAGSSDHQGIAARVDPFPYADAEDLLEADNPLIIVLDGVSADELVTSAERVNVDVGVEVAVAVTEALLIMEGVAGAVEVMVEELVECEDTELEAVAKLVREDVAVVELVAAALVLTAALLVDELVAVAVAVAKAETVAFEDELGKEEAVEKELPDDEGVPELVTWADSEAALDAVGPPL